LESKTKKPISIYTNGPVEIGIQAGPLVTVSEGYTIKPFIGISLLNREEITDKDKNIITRWEGKIKNIEELILLTPPGIEIRGLENCEFSNTDERRLNCPCNVPFKEYTSEECKSTCDGILHDPCIQVCKDVYDTSDLTGDAKDRVDKEKENCKTECETTTTKCKTECEDLFKPTGEDNLQGDYHAYALDVDHSDFKDLNKDIDRARSFRCRFEPSPEVLDNTPITTRYFRVRAKYNYLLENRVQVPVEKSELPYVSLTPTGLRLITFTDLCKDSECMLTEKALKSLEDAQVLAKARDKPSLEVTSTYMDIIQQSDLWDDNAKSYPDTGLRQKYVCDPNQNNAESKCPHLSGKSIDVRFEKRTMTPQDWEDLNDIMISAGWTRHEDDENLEAGQPQHFDCCITDTITPSEEEKSRRISSRLWKFMCSYYLYVNNRG